MDSCAIICPVYARVLTEILQLRRTVASLLAQSDDGWRLYLVDDGSPESALLDAIGDIRAQLRDKIRVCHLQQNSGQGNARNIGAKMAAADGLDYCVYLDSDDLADPKRVKSVRENFSRNYQLDFMYSAFDVVDQNGDTISGDLLVPSIKEILECFRSDPPEGRDTWRRIVAETGYVTLTSTVSVRTRLALEHSFPTWFVSEDQHAWLRMTAASKHIEFDRATRTKYRVVVGGRGSSVRERIGKGYYSQKAWVDSDGFYSSLPIAVANGLVRELDVPTLASKFLQRCAQTLDCENLRSEAGYYRDLAQRAALTSYADMHLTRPIQPPMFVPSKAQTFSVD